MSWSSLFQAVLNTVKWNPEVQDYCLLLLYYQNAMQISWGMCSLLAVSTGEIKLWFLSWLLWLLPSLTKCQSELCSFAQEGSGAVWNCLWAAFIVLLHVPSLALITYLSSPINFHVTSGIQKFKNLCDLSFCKMQLIYLLQQCVGIANYTRRL